MSPTTRARLQLARDLALVLLASVIVTGVMAVLVHVAIWILR